MKYEDRIVVFIDILGFKAIIRNTLDENGNEIESRVEKLNNALLIVREMLDMDKPAKVYSQSKRVTQFSDSIVISFRVQEQSEVYYTLLSLLHLTIGFVYAGILCRGGVAFGKLVHTDKLLFGPALVMAYETESMAALYPRIILGESIITLGAKYHAFHHGSKDEEESILSILNRDTDGMYYIDYFNNAQSELNDPQYDIINYIEKLRLIILNLSKYDNPDIMVKCGWMKDKFNALVKSCHDIDFLQRLRQNGEIGLADAYESITLF
jgi:hypothetical protein